MEGFFGLSLLCKKIFNYIKFYVAPLVESLTELVLKENIPQNYAGLLRLPATSEPIPIIEHLADIKPA
jgi:hypothetical protein